MNELKDNPKLLIYVLIAGIAFVIVSALIGLIFVWSGNLGMTNPPASDEAVLGSYKVLKMTEAEVVSKYCANIITVLSSGNDQDMYNMVLPSYIASKQLNQSQMMTLLKQKNLYKTKLKFTTYTSISHPTYGRVFEVELETIDGQYKNKMLIIEYSPNDYRISFDGFVGEMSLNKKRSNYGLTVTFSKIKEQTNMTTLSFTIKNESGHTIIINKENNYECIYVKYSSGQQIRMSSTWLSGATKEISIHDTISLSPEFTTQSMTYGFAQSIIIKNVYDTVSKETKDLEFSIY